MAQKVKMIEVGVAAVLVIAALFLMLFSVSFYPGTSYEAKGAVSSGGQGIVGTSSVSSAGSYDWHYNPFESSANSFIFIAFGFFTLVLTAVRLREKNDLKTIAVASLGALFLSGALVSAVGALQNLLSANPNSQYNASVGNMYGWMLYVVILAAIGGALAYLAEKWRTETGAERSVYSVIAHTFGLYLALYGVLLFTGASVSTINYINSDWNQSIVHSPVRLLGWIVCSAILFYVAWKLIEYSKKDGSRVAQYAYHTPVSFAAAVTLIWGAVACTAYLSTVIGHNYSWSTAQHFALGIAYTIVGYFLTRKLVEWQEKKNVQRTGHIWLMLIGVGTMVLFVFAVLISMYELVAGRGSAADRIINCLLCAIYGGILFYGALRMSKKYEGYKIQEGSVFGLLVREENAGEETKSAAGKADVAKLEKRIAELEARVLRLEKGSIAKKKG